MAISVAPRKNLMPSKSTSASAPANRLLALLPPSDYQRLLPYLQDVRLPRKQLIYRVRAPIDYVYFPSFGVVSAMTIMEDGTAIEVATIGNEGMSGLSAFIGGIWSPYEVMVQVEGEGVRMPADKLKQEVSKDGALRQLLILYHAAFSTQVSYSVACNGLHKIEQRCCRWLLMTADRVGSDILPLTHEFLAIMLGVRRPSLTEVLQSLQDRGLIHNKRGVITVVDRAKLEATSCECYRSVLKEFTRLFGSFGE